MSNCKNQSFCEDFVPSETDLVELGSKRFTRMYITQEHYDTVLSQARDDGKAQGIAEERERAISAVKSFCPFTPKDETVEMIKRDIVRLIENPQ